jgi:uncharacterized protein
MQPVEVDAFEFSRRKDSRQGQVKAADLPRLAEETVDDSGQLQWSVQGGADTHGNPALAVVVTGEVRLQCQRCLQPMDLPIDSRANVVLAVDEASADALDEMLADEAVEVVVGSQTFNLLALVEDEALLALPAAPRHENCSPQALAKAEDQASGKKESPFAVLGKLKR